MRPVLLNMTGFGSFRDATSVSFDGADYFALVGPTGSGKSTVIDALTFALYGSVPRWDDRRTVALALAPTVTRGTVRLLFDAGGARYVVVRELRRAANGRVNQKNARLERLVDPQGLGAAEEDTEPLAADSAVTKAVEELLGLTFEHFCTCVVLPQGDFADFLHALPADRQKILVKLLGLGVYETIGKAANAQASEQQQRAGLLAEQLGAFADATEEAVASAALRVGQLQLLQDDVAARLPQVAAAADAVAGARAEVSRLEAERAVLAAVAVPKALGALAERHRTALAAQAAANAALVAAEQDDDGARDALHAAPARGPLEQLARDHAELALLQEQHPGLAAEAGSTAHRAAAAGTALTGADAAVEAARAGRDRGAVASRSAQAEVDRLAAEAALLDAVTTPPQVAGLAGALTAARERAGAAEAALHAAEVADGAARAALRDAPAAAALVSAVDDHRALTALLAEAPVRRSALDDAQARLDQARTAEQAAVAALEAGRRERDAAARSSLVAALRPALEQGSPCPVCEQDVAHVPPPLHDADLSAAEQRLSGLQAALEVAHKDAQSAAGALQTAGAAVTALDERVEGLRAALAGAPATAAQAEAALTEVRTLEEPALVAEQDVVRARSDATAARAAVDAAEGALTGARTDLLTARDPLVPLGAPALEADDLVAAWTTLTGWATGRLAQRQEQLADARTSALAAAEEATAQQDACAAAERAAAAARTAWAGATTAEQRAAAALTSAEDRREQLLRVLAPAPPPAAVQQQLADLAVLEAAVQRTGAAVRAARTASSLAGAAMGALAAELAGARAELVAVRDPLVALGAPPVDVDDLEAGWAALAGWAAEAAHARDDALLVAAGTAADAGHALAALEAVVLALLTDAGIDLPPGRQTAAAAGEEAAAALAAARATHARVLERRTHAAGLLDQQRAAQEAQQVAHTLGLLLRADAFPRWLVASALDVLVDEASATLADLSGGQFELTHDDGDFLVVDHADADSRRPVKTLSGGETFQASLALALALSTQLATMSALGGARLDSIFLDEGFGTLDEATLDVVAGTLETLSTRGSRMVGVVTHVPALADRVPVRFRVRRDATSSRIEREDL